MKSLKQLELERDRIEEEIKAVQTANVSKTCFKAACTECFGTGVFDEGYDDDEECETCEGVGWRWVRKWNGKKVKHSIPEQAIGYME